MRSLALVTNLVEEGDRLPKVRDLLLLLLGRHLEQAEVVGALAATLLPVLAVWMREQDRGLYYDLLDKMLVGVRDNADSASSQKVSYPTGSFQAKMFICTRMYRRHCCFPVINILYMKYRYCTVSFVVVRRLRSCVRRCLAYMGGSCPTWLLR